jgi:NADH dehydrogenase (ubiquinone) 1 alpha subcomplex subunit 9
MASPPIPRTLSLPGPSTLSFEYLLDLVSTITFNPPSRAPVVPKSIALALAKVAQAAWWPALSPDEVERRFMDDVDVPGHWDDVGVSPTEIEYHALTYLRRFRSSYVLLPCYLLRLTWYL